MLVPNGLNVGDVVVAGPNAEARVGNALPLANIPLGTTIHNIELVPGKGGQIVRSAGTSAQLLAKEGDYAQVRLPVGRGPPRRHALHGHRRPGRQPRSREPEPRQGRPRPAHGPAARSARRGHEPARPSARWRRGQVARPACRPRRRGASPPWATAPVAPRPPGGSSSAPGTASSREEVEPMSRSLKKGPFVEARLLGRVQEMNSATRRRSSRPGRARASSSRLHRPHHRRLQRQEAHPGLRDREHGRPSPRRVQPDPQLPRARQAHRALDGAEVGAPIDARFRHRQVPPPLDAQDAPGHRGRSSGSPSRRPPPCCGSCRRRPPATWPRCSTAPTANAENNHDLSADDLFVVEAVADEGPTIKRFRPRAQGRAFPIHKPMTHITVVVENQEA